MRLREQ